MRTTFGARPEGSNHTGIVIRDFPIVIHAACLTAFSGESSGD